MAVVAVIAAVAAAVAVKSTDSAAVRRKISDWGKGR